MSQAERTDPRQQDVSLVGRVARGEDGAAALLCQTYMNAVYRFVYHHVQQQREVAEELTLDTLRTAVSLARNYNPSACSELTWLCGIAKTRIALFRRDESRLKRIPSDQLMPLEDALEVPDHSAPHRIDAMLALEAIKAALSEDEWEALQLHHGDGRSLDEIALLMKRTRKAIDNLLTRARKKAMKVGAEWM